MFIIKKIITPILMPPGLFVVILFAIGGYFFFKKKYLYAFMNILIGLLIWILSTSLITNSLLKGLESQYWNALHSKGDVIILLGGGIIKNVHDLTGTGFPNGDTLGRMTTAIRLHHRLNVPIILTGGKVFNQKQSCASIMRRVLVDLGVDQRYIIIEAKSRDTYENALFCEEICIKKGFKRPILLTSGYHLKRAQWIFNKVGLDVSPVPAYLLTSSEPGYYWRSYLPSSDNLRFTSLALHEYLCLLYYNLIY